MSNQPEPVKRWTVAGNGAGGFTLVEVDEPECWPQVYLADEIDRDIRALEDQVADFAGSYNATVMVPKMREQAATIERLEEDRDLWKKSESDCAEVNEALETRCAELEADVAALKSVVETTEINAKGAIALARQSVVAQDHKLAEQATTIDRLRSQPSYSGVLRAADSLSGTITLQVSAEMFAAASVVTDGAYVVSRYQEDA